MNINSRLRLHPPGGPGRRAWCAGGYDMGVAFDGDADRCLLVDETGGVIDGDKVLAVCALDMKRRGKL